MDAAKLLSALDASGLEGPTKVDESVVETAFVAKVLALGVSLEDLEPDARGAIEFFCRRLYDTFIAPMLVTGSRAAFLELWSEQSGSALRLMDGLFLCMHEVQRASESEVISRRLEHSDRRVIRESARTLGQRFDEELGTKLKLALTGVEEARKVFVSLEDPPLDHFKRFHRGLLIWALGNHLCIQLAERASSLVEDAPLRPDLAEDVVGFANDGARMAGLFAAAAAGLEFVEDISARAGARFQSTPFVVFLLQATREIRRVFGEQARFVLFEFDYPDEPEEWEHHVVIDAPLSAREAGEALDRLCEQWWDAAVAELGVDIFPVLGVIDDG